MKKIIEVNNFAKSYGDIKAVKGISFYVEEGKLFSFLGPNGAGKSTTIDTLCTLMDFDCGEISVAGYDLRGQAQEIRKNIGVVFQDSVLDDLLTVRENLSLRGALYIRDKRTLKKAVNNVIEICGLGEFYKRPYEKLSGGQRRRVDIAAALLQKPRILFLDEPTTGLDPQTRRAIWETLARLQKEYGMTVFLTTHYMEEAAESDYIIVIDHGEIAAKGTPAELKTRYTCDTLRISPLEDAPLREKLDSMKMQHTFSNGIITVRLYDTMAALPVLESCKQYIASFQVLQGTMDDAFIGITGRDIR
jgi:multidrug/hemolysin transport system ATP-binding protein